MNIQKMMKQVQKAQEQMQAVQAELANKTVEATAGGGMVTVTANGLNSITLDPEVVDKDDVEMLQDLIVAAINEAKRRASEMASAEMQRAAGSLGLPPGMI